MQGCSDSGTATNELVFHRGRCCSALVQVGGTAGVPAWLWERQEHSPESQTHGFLSQE